MEENKRNKDVITIIVCVSLSVISLIIQYFFKGGV